MKELFEIILDFLFPRLCIECKKPGFEICDNCLKKCSKYEKQRCFVCDKFSRKGLTHENCKNEYSPSQLIVINKYDEIEKKIIHKLKYQNRKSLARIVSDIIVKDIDTHRFDTFTICPIPIHKKRLRNRGYNQVELIARCLAEKLEINTEKLLIRIKNTKPQNKLNRLERMDNLEHAFDINNKLKIPTHVLLLDDLTTSGSTFREASKILKQNGVKDVICLAFARGK